MSAIYRQRTSEQSELGLEYREYTCDMGVSLSLLNDSWDDGASPWDALPVVPQVPDATGRLTRCLAVRESKRKRPPLARSAAHKVLLFTPQFAPPFGRPCGWVQRGIGSGRQAIVAWIMREEFHPRVGLALISLEGQGQSSVSKMQGYLDF